MKKLSILVAFIGLAIYAFATAPANYYTPAYGTTGENLRQALHDIIDGHTDNGYRRLYDVYEDSDDKNGKVWDIYSTCSFGHSRDNCGQYQKVCDCYNREHSVPQSWFDQRSPMRNDAFHVYPTDGKVNGQRSNHLYGECTSGTTLPGGHALGRLGSSTSNLGYNGTVFEPVDEYKGDIARTYFYFVTRYAGQCENWKASVFGANSGFATYTMRLMLKWAKQDPISQKEITRNEGIYKWQRNRNPFIDNAGLENYIWGAQKGQKWNGETGVETPEENPISLEATQVSESFVLSGTSSKTFTVQLFNIQGKCVRTFTTQAGVENNVSDLAKGIYFVNIQNGNKHFTEKMMIQ